MDGAKLIITIVGRGQGDAVEKLYSDRHVRWHYRSVGAGTASSELLDVLGLGTTERDVLFSLGSKSAAERLMRLLKEDRPESLNAKGLAFDAPLTGLNNLVAAALERHGPSMTENGGLLMPKENDSSLIMLFVNQGHTDEVMNTARAAGARGGTILRTRHSGPEEDRNFLGFTVQEERELVFIVANGETRNTIMETVNKKHGLKTPAGAVILSLPLDHTVRL